MRWVLTWVLLLGACESRYGTYFHVDGASNQIRFNHVQLYFGTPSSRSQIGMPSGATNGIVFDRDDDPSDRFDVPANSDSSLATESEYYLPVNDHNRQLAYVGAAVYDTTSTTPDRPVGFGEVKAFRLEDGLVTKYEIELQHVGLGDRAEVWGGDPNCFAWTRRRDNANAASTIAVLLANDSDCDGVLADADCNDLCGVSSTSGICAPESAICGDRSKCGLGCATDKNCSIDVCLPGAACSDTCAKRISLDGRLVCVAEDPGTSHISISVDNTSVNTPCTTSFVISNYGRPCTGPRIEWSQTLSDGWSFTNVTTATNPMNCLLTMTNANTGASLVGDHHTLISFAPTAPSTLRGTILVGVQPTTPATVACLGGVDSYRVDQLNVGAPFDCP